jgi:hypothetical protein
MQKLLFAFLLLAFIPEVSEGQSLAMKNLSEKHEDDGFVLMFYYSTLKMLIPENNTDFQELIYDIEKIKMLRLDNDVLEEGEYSKIIADLNKDGFEEVITMRHNGDNVMVYLKEKRGMTKGAFFMMESDSTLTTLDLVGQIPIDKLFTLSNEIDMLTDANQNILFGN